jgi:uncharacterized protein (DUF1778 family)
MARYTEAQNKATQKYIHNSYDQLSIRIRKDGELTRADIQSAADQEGKSINQYILEAVSEKMNKSK